jgi:hypothetical protein
MKMGNIASPWRYYEGLRWSARAYSMAWSLRKGDICARNGHSAIAPGTKTLLKRLITRRIRGLGCAARSS